MKVPLLLCLIAGLFASASFAQTPTPAPDDTSRAVVWRAQLPGGTYTVLVRAMTSVSTHEYIVDNVGRVTEMIVDTTGNAIARFYYIEPLTPESPLGIGQSTINKAQELLEEAADRTGQDHVWKQVMKNYPTTTHAHTIEYRLESKDSLDKLFKSADKAFRNSKADTIKIE